MDGRWDIGYMGGQQSKTVPIPSSMSADLPPGLALPMDVFPVIFQHLPQEGLCACLRVCKTFHHIITTDQVLLARLQLVRSYRQFKNYLEVGKTYYHAEYYSDIGQNDDAKFPYCDQFVVRKLSHVDKPEMHMDYASVALPGEEPSCSGSMLFSEEYMMKRNDIYGVNKFDVMLQLLEKLWAYLNSPKNAGTFSTMPFINTNMRKAVKKLKQHTKENPKFGVFAVLQAGHTQWFKEVMRLRPKDEPESSSDEELSPEVAEENVGKAPIYFCKRCQWQVGGFTCRSEKNGTCGELLVLQQDTSLRCPKGCGVMGAPVCCRRRAMKVTVDPKYTVTASSSQDDTTWEACPVFSCEKCNFGVDGIRCFTCTSTGKDVERNGFFERVWCAYVWTCPSGCGRRDRGGLTHGGFISCKCQGDKDLPLKEYSYVEKFGPPQN